MIYEKEACFMTIGNIYSFFITLGLFNRYMPNGISHHINWANPFEFKGCLAVTLPIKQIVCFVLLFDGP